MFIEVLFLRANTCRQPEYSSKYLVAHLYNRTVCSSQMNDLKLATKIDESQQYNLEQKCKFPKIIYSMIPFLSLS